MKKVDRKSENVYGIKVRTENALEVNPNTSKIIGCWGEFMLKYPPQSLDGQIYGVYTNYESDENGKYDFIAGSNAISLQDKELDKVELMDGEYRKFIFNGSIPECVVTGWQHIWKFYNEEDYIRAFTTDYELYTNEGVEIYIAEQ